MSDDLGISFEWEAEEGDELTCGGVSLTARSVLLLRVCIPGSVVVSGVSHSECKAWAMGLRSTIEETVHKEQITAWNW